MLFEWTCAVAQISTSYTAFFNMQFYCRGTSTYQCGYIHRYNLINSSHVSVAESCLHVLTVLVVVLMPTAQI